MGTRNPNKKLGPTIGEIIDRRWGVKVRWSGDNPTIYKNIRDASGGVCQWTSGSEPGGIHTAQFKYQTKEQALLKVASFIKIKRIHTITLIDWNTKPHVELPIFERPH